MRCGLPPSNRQIELALSATQTAQAPAEIPVAPKSIRFFTVPRIGSILATVLSAGLEIQTELRTNAILSPLPSLAIDPSELDALSRSVPGPIGRDRASAPASH